MLNVIFFLYIILDFIDFKGFKYMQNPKNLHHHKHRCMNLKCLLSHQVFIMSYL